MHKILWMVPLTLFLNGCLFGLNDFEGSKCPCKSFSGYVCVEIDGEGRCHKRDNRDLCPDEDTILLRDVDSGQPVCAEACDDTCRAEVGCTVVDSPFEICNEPDTPDMGTPSDMGSGMDLGGPEDMNSLVDMNTPVDMNVPEDMGGMEDMESPLDMEEPLCPIAGGLDCQCRDTDPRCDGSLVCDSGSVVCRLPVSCGEICAGGQKCNLPTAPSSQGECLPECMGDLVFNTDTEMCESTLPPRYDCPSDRRLTSGIRAVCIEPTQSFTPGPSHQSSAISNGVERAVRGAIRAPFGGGEMTSADSRRVIRIGIAR